MGIPSPTARAVQIAVAIEVAWAIYAAYVVHHYTPQTWRLAIINFVDTWAHAAVAIVVMTWLADIAVAQRRERRP
jgi:hypothetical protein